MFCSKESSVKHFDQYDKTSAFLYKHSAVMASGSSAPFGCIIHALGVVCVVLIEMLGWLKGL